MLPDHTGFVTLADEQKQRVLEAEQSERIDTGLKDFLEGKVRAARRQKKQDRSVVVGYDEQERRSNRAFVVSLDHQMREGAGISICNYVPVRPLIPLQAKQKRYLCMANCPIQNRQRLRVCVQTGEDDETCQRRFELPVKGSTANSEPPAWHVCSDMGSVGWPALTWLMLKQHVRMTHIWDRSHRLVNDWTDSVKHAGLTLTRMEWAQVSRCRLGPYDKAKHHSELLGFAKEMFEKQTDKSIVFRWLYRDICEENSWHHDASFGQEAHCSRVWERCC